MAMKKRGDAYRVEIGVLPEGEPILRRRFNKDP
jgi:hypothetical protein